MVDFHSHFLPGIDDGAENPTMSIGMLEESYRQGVDVMFATPHFYADQTDPEAFLRRRERACRELKAYYDTLPAGSVKIPKMYLGAEVYYFPGIADCEEMRALALGNSRMLLVEPPVAPFEESMLQEIENIYPNLGLIPVMAHLDRYCAMLRDRTLFDRVAAHRIDIQVNASFFLRPGSRDFALRMLQEERFSLMGSDCHNLTTRAPNLGEAQNIISAADLKNKLEKLNVLSYNVLNFNG